MRHKLRFAEANAGVAMPVNGVQSNVYALSKENLMKKSKDMRVIFLQVFSRRDFRWLLEQQDHLL